MNITKETITSLEEAALPPTAVLLQIRSGKVQTLGDQPSGIFKKELSGHQFVGPTGFQSDEHVYWNHGGTERALHQYPSSHYPDWRLEAPHPDLFNYGGFGENLVATGLTEENVCVGDLYKIGEVVLQVSEPRSPCSKLNVRFQWPRALKRVQRTARVGWNFRVLKTGYVGQGDRMVLLERPNPRWSVLNVKRVIQGKTVALPLVSELVQLDVITDMMREYATKRLETTMKEYKLVEAEMVTSRVRKLTFELQEQVVIPDPAFHDFAFAQIEFGEFKRSYSIVAGDMKRFTLGIALDDHSRGGSAYLHGMKCGELIKMAPGGNPKDVEEEEKAVEEGIEKRIVIIGGIGVTAFLPMMRKWEADDIPFEIHYAVRDPDQAAFLDMMPHDKTTVYAKTRGERLSVDVIPKAGKVYACGPGRLMKAAKERAQELSYPDHRMHFEDFGSGSGPAKGDPFEAEVFEVDTERRETLQIGSDKTLLQVLRESGFDMTYFCEAGLCGACKVTVCKGDVKHNGAAFEKGNDSMLSCADRGLGKIQIELD